MRNPFLQVVLHFEVPKITISKMAVRCHLGKPNFSKYLSLNVVQIVILEGFWYE